VNKIIMHNGYTAKILSDSGVCLWAKNADGDRLGFVASPSKADKKEFFLAMAAAGATEVMQSHERYISFNLRHVMSKVGGNIVDSATYTRNGDKWVRQAHSRKGFSYDT
jgi:hypothetical protein